MPDRDQAWFDAQVEMLNAVYMELLGRSLTSSDGKELSQRLYQIVVLQKTRADIKDEISATEEFKECQEKKWSLEYFDKK